VKARDRLAFALDYPDLRSAIDAARVVGPEVGVLKVGLELFVREGPAAVREVAAIAPVFLDLKLHDIPETVARAVASARELGVRWLTIHASGGPEMIARAVEAARGELGLLAVTVLTSLDDDDLRAAGFARGAADQVEHVARMAADAGARGFVAAPTDAARLRAALPAGTILVTPGVRPAGTAAGDQKRVASVAGAIAAGADLLVVGRPIRDAADPAAAARAIVQEISAALEAAV